jgi:predicted nucleic acid-binding protein
VRFLLDTNVVSELRKASLGRIDPNVARWAEGIHPADFCVSVITIHELEVGVLRLERRDAVQGAGYRTWLDSVIRAFDGRILGIDTAIAVKAAQFTVPDPHPVEDGLIAATASVYGLTVVTRNVEDFRPTGVSIFNPWNPH